MEAQNFEKISKFSDFPRKLEFFESPRFSLFPASQQISQIANFAVSAVTKNVEKTEKCLYIFHIECPVSTQSLLYHPLC